MGLSQELKKEYESTDFLEHEKIIFSKTLNNLPYITIYKMPKCVIHSPTLESIKMVEKTVKKYSQEYGKYRLWKKLPRKMMYQTFRQIIDYLEESGKIMIDQRDGIIFWTYNPERIEKLRREGLVFR